MSELNQKEFIEFIKKMRVNKMMSQKDIAKRICISKSAYSKIENHKQTPSLFVVVRLAEIFDIDLNDFKTTKKDFMNYD